ncbi:MAG: SdrD B-like domain-containing protein [Bacteroidia bacterium]
MGGISWLSNTTGSRLKSYQIFTNNDGIGTLGKANGLGDLEAMCSPAPLEIGNRVWNDLDEDGIQDACEPGIDGVLVELYKGGSKIAEYTTSSGGQYYFSDDDAPGVTWTGTGADTALIPGTAYEIRIPGYAGQTPIIGLDLTIPDAGSNDEIDSDAADVSGNAVINLTTGIAGCDDHSYDIGFVLSSTVSHTKVHTSTTPVTGLANTYDVIYTIEVGNSGSADTIYALFDTATFDDDISILNAAFTSATDGTSAAAPGAGLSTTNGAVNTITASTLIAAGDTHTYTLTYRVVLDLEDGFGDNVYRPCGTGTNGSSPGEALHNGSALDVGADGSIDESDEACDDLPYIIHSKALAAGYPIQQANGSWNVRYTVTVQNIGGADGSYSLSDQPGFENDVVITVAGSFSAVSSGTNTPAGGALGTTNTANVLATSQAIDSGASHTYTLDWNVNLLLEDAAGATGDNSYDSCGAATPGIPQTGEGLFNESQLDVNSDGTADARDTACADLPYLILTKTLAATPLTGTGPYTVHYVLTVENIGGVATSYNLDDKPDFDDDIVISSGGFTSATSDAGSHAATGAAFSQHL